MNRALLCLSAVVIMMSALPGCTTSGTAQPSDMGEREPDTLTADCAQPEAQSAPPDARDQPELFAHTAEFTLDLGEGTLSAEITYAGSDRPGGSFLLNRALAVTALLCDGEEIDPEAAIRQVNIEGRFPVNRYDLPEWADSLVIRYTGTLGGAPWLTTYSHEDISEAFALLRWETYCYPLFEEELLDLFEWMDRPLRAELTVRVPEGYLVATPYTLLEQETRDGVTSWRFDGDLASLNVAMAQYQVLELSSGIYYFLPGTDPAEMEGMIDPVMAEAERFLSGTFGAAEIPRGMRYIVIPEGYGGWAINGRAVFLTEEAFATEQDLLGLVHEFIHLGWNPKTETANRAVSRARFFDEGITCYLQSRVAGHLWGEEAYQAEIARSVRYLKAQSHVQRVPIAEYGVHDYGRLSYYIGPVLFDALAQLVGTDALDAATAAFLEQYRDTPVDFDRFVAAYTELLDHPEVEAFFDDWVYSTEGITHVLRE